GGQTQGKPVTPHRRNLQMVRYTIRSRVHPCHFILPSSLFPRIFASRPPSTCAISFTPSTNPRSTRPMTVSHPESAQHAETGSFPRYINIRSDTQTLPTPEMRRAIAEAELGDDTYG